MNHTILHDRDIKLPDRYSQGWMPQAWHPSARFPLRLALCAFLLLACLPLGANPFMGQKDDASPSPVRAGKPASGALVRNQLELRTALAEYLKSWKEEKSAVLLLSIIGASFLYGVLHALGPGHRKIVVFSIYIARKSPWWEPFAASLSLASLHGGMAILLLFLFRSVSGALSSSTAPVSLYMEGFAWTSLVLLSSFLLLKAVLDLLRKKSHTESSLSLGALILTGIYPCPGAILVLILATSLNSVSAGIISVSAMSLGMSLPILLFAYLGWFGREGLVLSLRKNEALLRKAGTLIEIAGFAFLLLFSAWLSAPFVSSMFRIFLQTVVPGPVFQ